MGCSSSKSTATADTLGPPPAVAAPTGGEAGGTKRGTPQPTSTTPQPAGVGGGKKTPPAGGEPAAAQAALRIGVGGNTRLSARELASGVSPVATPGGTLKPRVDPRALADLPPAAVLAAVLNDAGYFANLLNLLLRKAHTTTKPSEAGVSSTGAAEGDIVKALDNPVTRAAFQKLVDTIALSTEERFCHGDTVLEIACAAGAADVVDLLLRASPHLVNHVKAQTGNTLLHLMFTYNSPACVDGVMLLMEAGVNVNAVNARGDSALQMATSHDFVGLIAVFRFLSAFGLSNLA
ncbi:hypothetical protein EON62_04015 [archaeon]|nr:MAG: hypothetical protein EON62_04015 [archaeon]